MSLILLLIVPMLTALGVLFFKNAQPVRVISLTGAVLQLLLVLGLMAAFYQARMSGDTHAFLFMERWMWFGPFNIQFITGVDGISLSLLLLTAAVVLAGVLVSWKEATMTREFFFLLHLLALGAYGFFISLDVFTLFFFLEIAVIPKYLLIGVWGSGKKEYSANKLALMLMGGSALVLVGMLGMYYQSGVLSFDLIRLSDTSIPFEVQRIFFPFLFVGFGIFTAIFPFHTWVPDGHSSAPTAGSMFLAGISMKLGGYGCLRVAAWLMPDAAAFYAPYIIILATIAIIYGAFATLMQTDLKYINAYSSVSHCGFVLLGIGMLNQTAITGAIMQMVSHGLMTALFFAVIGMIYQRTHTRMVRQMGGLLKIMPFIMTMFFIAGLTSLGLPGFSGFVAEMTVFAGAWQHEETIYRLTTIITCSSIVVTAVYILRAAGSVAMGPLKSDAFTREDATWQEKTASLILGAGIVAIGIAPFWLNDLIQPGAEIIMQKFISYSR
jgi:NADH-quinone oxidoreductase subunit M